MNRIYLDSERPDFPGCGCRPRGCYGDSMPAYMMPEHHPDYRPYVKPKVRRSGCPGARPFDWRKGAGKRDSLTRQATRLKANPPAQTWQGDFPNAPPSGQGAQGSKFMAAAWEPKKGVFVYDPLAPRNLANERYNPETQSYEVGPVVDYGRHGLKRQTILQEAAV